MDHRINETPVIIIRRAGRAPKRLTLDQVCDRLWPRYSDTEADIRRKLRSARRLPTSHPAIAASREHLIEALDVLL